MALLALAFGHHDELLHVSHSAFYRQKEFVDHIHPSYILYGRQLTAKGVYSSFLKVTRYNRTETYNGGKR